MTRFWSKSDFKEWPPGISSRLVLRCQKCDTRPEFDFQVDDETWRKITPPDMRRGVICLPCLDKMAVGAGVDICQHLREVQYTGCRSTVVLCPAIVVEIADTIEVQS